MAAHIAEHHGEPALAAAIAPSLMAQMMARLDYKAIRPATVPAWAALLPSGTAHRQVPLQLDAGPSARLSAAQPEPATPAQKEEH